MHTMVDFETQLRAAGLRVTKQRLTVLDTVDRQPHSDTASILDAVRRTLTSISHQAVYDALSDLTDAGLLRKFQPQGSAALYETRTGDNHHHLACRDCGNVVDVDCTLQEMPCLTPLDDQGYLIDEAEVIYWGSCPSCSTRSQPTPDQDNQQGTSRGERHVPRSNR
ncbi:MAG: transcriptional repressor [Nocardioidaceae bacterium]|nr:transcriptional repressor [Nocardioidaceae bacterium]MCB8993707.1 transcriptional repressor [Nocardioidaceae bacterium]MCO5324376.1 transcriptional repressor [Nocardioidaceae bacterium]